MLLIQGGTVKPISGPDLPNGQVLIDNGKIVAVGTNLEVPEGTTTVEQVSSIMNQNPAWADGLCLASSGFWGRYYFKD